MNRMIRTSVMLMAFFCYLHIAHAQVSSQQIADNLESDARVSAFTMESSRGTPFLIEMTRVGATLSLGETSGFLQSVLGHGAETTFVNEMTTTTKGMRVDKFQQYTNGIKVEHGVFKALSQKDVVLAFSAEYYNLPASIQSTPGLSEDAALQFALNHVGASLYAWDYIASLGTSPELTAAYDDTYPSGKLVFVDNYNTDTVDPTLAYKFNVYAAEPVSRADIYVDAATGEILLEDAIIKHVGENDVKEELSGAAAGSGSEATARIMTTGSGDTRYAGRRSFDTSLDGNGNWVLNGVTPTGIENETRSYDGLTPPVPLVIYTQLVAAVSVPIADGDGTLLHPETADNSWDEDEHRVDRFSATNPYPIANESRNDDVALDAHWGAEVVLNYWKEVHDRNSYDDQGTKVSNYVHFGDAYDNAFWNGVAMTYGDGSYQGGTNPDGSFAPLTSMDVCSHEIAHGVTEFTSDLVYANESGAMNEGFSDVWAAAVESYVLTEIDGSLDYDPWGIGEQIDERDGGIPPGQANSAALRWMDDPKAAGDPDSYGGDNWISQDCSPTLANDQCGVHTNSGVLNKWFYLMVTGSGQPFSPGAGKASIEDEVTDAGNSYSVDGLGYGTASDIAYLSQIMLTPNAKFAEMRQVSILNAQLLYGTLRMKKSKPPTHGTAWMLERHLAKESRTRSPLIKAIR